MKITRDKEIDPWMLETWNINEATNSEVRERVKQQKLMTVWQNAESNSSHMKPSEIKEWNLKRRIAAITEGDTLESRVLQEVIESEKGRAYSQLASDEIQSGQGEEEFLQEREDQRRKHIKNMEKAEKIALQRIKTHYTEDLIKKGILGEE